MIFEFQPETAGEPHALQARHRLAGAVTVDGLPARRSVLVFRRDTAALVACSTSSQTTGLWEIYGLNEFAERGLMIIAVDSTGNYNSEIADHISQVATVTP